MKQQLVFLFLCLPILAISQNFVTLGLDPSGDVNQPNVPDITKVAVATSRNQDSVWLRLTAANQFIGDWGLEIVIDTNEIPDDGKYLGGANPAGNDSLSYEMKLEVLNNNFFPPTHKILADTSGTKFTQDINLEYSADSLILTISFALHHIGLDGSFNIMVGGASFDGIVRENAPNSEFYTVSPTDTTSTSVLQNRRGVRSEVVQLYPNPTSDKVHVETRQPIEEIRLFNGIGVELHTASIDFVSQQTALIDLANFPNGSYWVFVLSADGEQRITQLTKQ